MFIPVDHWCSQPWSEKPFCSGHQLAWILTIIQLAESNMRVRPYIRHLYHSPIPPQCSGNISEVGAERRWALERGEVCRDDFWAWRCCWTPEPRAAVVQLPKMKSTSSVNSSSCTNRIQRVIKDRSGRTWRWASDLLWDVWGNKVQEAVGSNQDTLWTHIQLWQNKQMILQ